MKKILKMMSAVIGLCFCMSMMVCAADDSRINSTQVENSGGNSNAMTASGSTARWSSVMKSYVYSDDGDYFYVVDGSQADVLVDKYKKSDLSLVESKTLPFELSIFGGFYAGEDYNFIVFGQTNPNQDDTLATFKTVKYSKTWEKLGAVDYCGNNTTVPFDAGSLRMVEYNGYLYVRSAHEMYQSDDGYNHQSNITYSVDIENMTIADEYSIVMNVSRGYVSHSFNQFIQIVDGKLACVDHGDAYPRSVVVGTYASNLENGVFSGRYNNVNAFEIPGTIGANCTGVTIGGFETGTDNYLIAINTIDHSKVTNYTSYQMVGLDVDERDVVVLVGEKIGSTSTTVKEVYLTDYVDNGKIGSTPYLVKLSDNKFLVMWEEFEYSGYYTKSNGLKYVFIDGNGKLLSEVESDANVNLARDCQPVLVGTDVLWYVNDGSGTRTVYELSTEEKEAEVTNPFTDVPESEYYYAPVLWAVENKITSGLTATSFAPEASCTRGQVVTFLWRAKGCPEPTTTTHNFTDLKANEYYYKAVLWAVEKGITSGMTKTTFAPDETVTRGQFVTFLHRAEGKPSYTASNPFTDLKTGEYYYDAVLWAVENQVTSGLKPTLFGPEEPCTRGQVVTFLYRAYN